MYTFHCRHEPAVLCYCALFNLNQVRTPVAIYIFLSTTHFKLLMANVGGFVVWSISAKLNIS